MQKPLSLFAAGGELVQPAKMCTILFGLMWKKSKLIYKASSFIYYKPCHMTKKQVSSLLTYMNNNNYIRIEIQQTNLTCIKDTGARVTDLAEIEFLTCSEQKI